METSIALPHLQHCSNQLKTGLAACFPNCNPLAKLLGADAADTHNFKTIFFVAGYANGGARYFQKFCKEFNAGLIGRAFPERGLQRDLYSVAHYAHKDLELRPRMHPHLQADAGAVSLTPDTGYVIAVRNH